MPSKRRDRLYHRALRKKKAVLQVRYIPKDEALKELKSALKNANYILEGLDENPLPDSIEVALKRKAVTPETAQQFEVRSLNSKASKK